MFDRLQNQINDRNKEGGITALDLADLPPALRKIMRLMLRQLQMTHPQLIEAMDKLPEKERLSRKDLDDALESLTKQAWLIRMGEGEKAVYKVNLRAKAGSTLASGIWSALDDKLKK
jgi:hypothetical protein